MFCSPKEDFLVSVALYLSFTFHDCTISSVFSPSYVKDSSQSLFERTNFILKFKTKVSFIIIMTSSHIPPCIALPLLYFYMVPLVEPLLWGQISTVITQLLLAG